MIHALEVFEPPQGMTRWLDTFEEAYRRQRGKRPENTKAYKAARKAQMESELPLSVKEVMQVIETAWLLDGLRFLK